MITPLRPTRPTARFTPREWEALRALHLRYQQDHDHFTSRELARLHFLRWLRDTGRIERPAMESRVVEVIEPMTPV